MIYYKLYNTFCSTSDDLPENAIEISEETYNLFISKNSELQKTLFELSRTDFKALKYAEGLISEEDYQEIKKHRQDLRDKINSLKEEIVNL